MLGEPLTADPTCPTCDAVAVTGTAFLLVHGVLSTHLDWNPQHLA